MDKLIIAIDGPAGAGKSTISKLIAQKVGIPYINTGAMYRAVGVMAQEKGIDLKDEKALEKFLENVKIDFIWDGEKDKILFNGKDITDKIFTPEAGKAASDVSTVPIVRKNMVRLQQELGKRNGGVLEGRDIGTVVFPDADIKIFLVASPEERAKRRYEELTAKGEKVDYNEILEGIKYRDQQDSTRSTAPLKKADDAVEIDTTSMSIEEVLDTIYNLVVKKQKKDKI